MRIGPPASRRRLRLAVKRGRSRLWLGLRERSGHEIVPLEMCTVADPALVALLAPLGEALAAWLTGPWPAEASLTLTDAGPDLLLARGAAAAGRRSARPRRPWPRSSASPASPGSRPPHRRRR